MSKLTHPKILIKDSPIHGKGAFAKKRIRKGERIIEYIGEKIPNILASKRFSNLRSSQLKNGQQAYLYQFYLNDKTKLDGNVPSNVARFINHSCDPNCEYRIQNEHIWFYAIKSISAGDEITYDFKVNINFDYLLPCNCHAKNCRGFIVGKEHWQELKKQLNSEKLKRKKLLKRFTLKGTSLSDSYQLLLDQIEKEHSHI